jgi:hypothetical protein
MLLKDGEVMPYLCERRSIILGKLDIVNKYRKDAHALIVDDQEMAEVRAAFDYLEVEFSEP